MTVSLIATVLNEGAALERLLNSIAAQTRLPDEVVICDGGSRDDTVARLEAERRFPVRVLIEPGANISRGRNVAIAATRGDLIVCTDAGVSLEPTWLARLVEAAEAAGLGPEDKRLVAGFFAPEATTVFELAMCATVLPLRNEIHPDKFLPSSRSVAFTRAGWEAAGRYPEWLDYCEDLIFDFRARAAGAFVPALDAIAHFRPRSSLRAFWRQYRLYARGDGKADLWPRRHLIRYAIYLLALPALLLGILFAPAFWIQALCTAALALGAGAYLRTPLRRLVTLWGKYGAAERLKALAWVPVIRVVGDVAKMVGYPAGRVWRRARLATQPELRWR